MKLDTQGHEVEILDGAKRVLREASLVIIKAYGVDEPGRMAFDQLCAHMRAFKFRPDGIADVLTRPCDGMLWQMDIHFVSDTLAAFGDSKFH